MCPWILLSSGSVGIIQPAIKCREYLRIIYGPEYSRLDNLERFGIAGFQRSGACCTGSSRSALTGPERFVRREPLRRVHECVFGVLALESEPVDPRPQTPVANIEDTDICESLIFAELSNVGQFIWHKDVFKDVNGIQRASLNQLVVGSIPTRPTKFKDLRVSQE